MFRYRFAEIYYRRSDSKAKPPTTISAAVASGSRVETTVLFIPDVWNICPTKLEWDGLHRNYEIQLKEKLDVLNGVPKEDCKEEEEEDQVVDLEDDQALQIC